MIRSKQDLFKLTQVNKISSFTMLRSLENERDVLDLVQKTKGKSTTIIKGAKS